MTFGRVAGVGRFKDCFGTRPSILSDPPPRSISGLLLLVASLVSRSRLTSEEEGAAFGGRDRQDCLSSAGLFEPRATGDPKQFLGGFGDDAGRSPFVRSKRPAATG